ncbi:SRPBCC family protein [Myxococcus xanthus]|uniref:SRPBCC family protein n=1 Tax=Myxococcus xanthus TaxID=34 RepID=UPI0019177E1B|nr:SRPBCC family protein [Myxococcus xanthus]QQR44819.1 SRPBCC family protein [Myxococcus xanthus]
MRDTIQQPGARFPAVSPRGGRFGSQRWRRPDRGLQRTSEERLPQLVSALAGGALLTLGLRRGKLGGVAMALAGGGLLFRGTRTEQEPHVHKHGVVVRKLRRQRGRDATVELTVLQRSITIQGTPEALYRRWCDAETLNQVMGHFADVTSSGEGLQHWKVPGVFGADLEWNAKVVEEHPGELLSWRSVGDTALPNEGWVRFRPAPRDWGTAVTLRFVFDPPGGVVGEKAVQLLGAVPAALALKALKRFKSLVETGEIPTTRPNPAAREGGYSS